jgi:hypothetical protein
LLHIIRQQHLHVELNGSESDGMALQRRLPALCRDWLLPALERTLDRHAPAEGTLCIERLEIDAGTMSLDRLEHDLAEAVAQELAKVLREQHLSADEAAAGLRKGNVRHKTAQHSIEEALVFFLETGQLPWSFRVPEGRSLEQLVLAAWQETEQRGGRQGAEQVRRVLASAAARKRLTRQFTPTLLRMLISRLAPAGAAAMDNMLQVLNSGKAPPAERRQIERLLWESAVARAAAGLPVTAEVLVRDILPTVSAEHAAAAGLLVAHWPSSEKNRLLLQAAETQLRHEETRDDMQSLDAESRSHAAAEPPAAAQKRLAKAAPLSDAPASSSPAWKSESDMKERASGKPPPGIEAVQLAQGRVSIAQEQDEALTKAVPPPSPVSSALQFAAKHHTPSVLLAEGIYISNAGLVLLHPFLPQFFTALGIAADKQLLQPERALCLLHFLATGQPVAPEFELMLPKVLCNIPFDEPVESDVALTAAEQDEAVSLLKAVIRHWEALRSTSPDGLRGTFFVRPGKISLRDGDWLLQVEPQTWDILLDQLPWGIGMIKLPWMDRLLHVEWN